MLLVDELEGKASYFTLPTPTVPLKQWEYVAPEGIMTAGLNRDGSLIALQSFHENDWPVRVISDDGSVLALALGVSNGVAWIDDYLLVGKQTQWWPATMDFGPNDRIRLFKISP